MRTPSLYVGIGVELFSSCNWLTSSYRESELYEIIIS